MTARSSAFIFARDVRGRIALFFSSALLAPLFGVIAYAIFVGPAPSTLEGWVFSAVVGELTLSGCVFFMLGLVWSLFTPKWLEAAVLRLTRIFVLWLGVFVLLCFPYAIWALFHA